MDNIQLRSDTNEEVTWEFMKFFSEQRKEQNLSVRDLGKKAGVSYTVIYDFEQRSVLPKMETLIKLANALGLCIDIKHAQGSLYINFYKDGKTVILKPQTQSKISKISPEEQLSKSLNLMGLQTKDIEEIKEYIAFKLSKNKK